MRLEKSRRTMAKSLFISAAACALTASSVLAGVAHAAGAPVEAELDLKAAGPVIDRQIFGQFAEHLGSGIYEGIWVGTDSKIPNVRGIRSDVVGALKAIKVPNVRWPGGCFADEYHWRDGIGPQDKRRIQVNTNWGSVTEPNAFGTHEYFDFIEQIGSEAYLSVNVGSGTAAEAAQWVEYVTAEPVTTLGKERAANGHAAPWKIAYLGVGNENWGCGGAMSNDHYVEELKRFTNFIRNFNPAQRTTSKMKRMAVGWDSGKLDYTESVMKAWKDHVYSWDIEGVSLHNYTVAGWPPHMPATGFGLEDYATIIKDTYRMDSLITTQKAVMDKYDPAKKLEIAVDEWGAWLAPTPGSNPGFLQQQNSLRDAILAAININIFARHADRVKEANIAQMVNVLQAMILTKAEKMVLTPTYHVFHMYVPFQDAKFVPLKVDAGQYVQGDKSMPRIDAVAARDKAGKLWVSLTNIDPTAAVSVRFGAAKAASGQVLTAAKVDTINTFEKPAEVAPVAYTAKGSAKGLVLEVPAKSVMVVQIDM
jgi:alpha-N-arabinofuranosidase